MKSLKINFLSKQGNSAVSETGTMDNEALHPLVLKVILALGVGLALWQFFYNRSLWIDEAMLANNLLNRDYLDLLRPLDERQAAPILFLWIERFFVQIIPQTEYALRIFPLLLYIGSTILFFRIIRETLTLWYSQVLAVVFFAVNYRLIYYASEVKQYMGDVFCTLLLLVTLIATLADTKKTYFPLSIVGITITFLSNISPIILLSAGIFLLLHTYNLKDSIKLIPLFATWLIAFATYYVFFIHGHPTKDYMLEFWRASFGFMPDLDNPWRVYLFFKVKFVVLFRMMMGMGMIEKYVIFGLFTVGLLLHRNKNEVKWAVLIGTPMLVHLILSYFEQYPLELRLTIYFIPLTILLTAKGFDYLMHKIALKKAKLAFMVAIALTVFTGTRISYAEMFPIEITDLKGLMAYVLEESQEEEPIYVVTMSSPTVRFYRQIGTFPKDRKYIVDSQESSSLKLDIEIFRNYTSPFWLLFTNLDNPDFDETRRQLEASGAKVLDQYCVVGGCGYMLSYSKVETHE
ncbi:ArnT family glycosyltransferase [Lunatibacter salilacus]|uniref:ArnT family glycosyltransferase n=1 Tax=Lunatibacter salilacus TaxID=2483804 RepID=UPI00131C1F0A|nr:glycosyltransferase family 39 protein [Lunatibacter salilacus]